MKRTSRFWIGLAAAAITFSSLTAFVGTDHWNHRREYLHHHGYDHWEGCPYYSNDKEESLQPDLEEGR